MTPEQIIEINNKFKCLDLKPGIRIQITAIDSNHFRYTVEGPIHSAEWYEPNLVGPNEYYDFTWVSGGWFIELKGDIKHSKNGTPGLILPKDYAYCKSCSDKVINIEIL